MKRKAMMKKNAPGKLTEGQLQYLTSGVCLDFQVPGDAGGGPFGSVEKARAAWQEHRDELMALRDEGSFESYAHGERPHGWWLFDAKEPKRIIGYFDDIHIGVDKDRHPMPILETEFAYLKRLGLLFPGEEEAVKRIQGRKVAG